MPFWACSESILNSYVRWRCFNFWARPSLHNMMISKVGRFCVYTRHAMSQIYPLGRSQIHKDSLGSSNNSNSLLAGYVIFRLKYPTGLSSLAAGQLLTYWSPTYLSDCWTTFLTSYIFQPIWLRSHCTIHPFVFRKVWNHPKVICVDKTSTTLLFDYLKLWTTFYVCHFKVKLETEFQIIKCT